MMDYELIDSGNGRRLEKFGQYLIDRPDPEVLWQQTLPVSNWDEADCKFVRTHEDKGRWETKPNFPESWIVNHNDLKILLKLSPFKHVGVFPEQDWQWDLISNITPKDSNILNLFGYTGVATLSALKKGAKVTHVDASRPAISWLNENLKLNSLENSPIRYIPEDCLKFTAREIKRGVKYDGIIMDPPVYGHGPNGEKWSFTKDFPILLDNVSKLLSDKPLFVIINAYAISTSPTTLQNMLQEKFSKLGGEITSGELTLKEESGGRILSTGIYAMWSK
jgi:23S rRNA (cytosine1962-C5)-methyltransferase